MQDTLLGHGLGPILKNPFAHRISLDLIEATDLANGQLPGLNEANLLLPEILAKPAEPSFFRCHFSDIYGKLSTSRLSTYIMRVQVCNCKRKAYSVKD